VQFIEQADRPSLMLTVNPTAADLAKGHLRLAANEDICVLEVQSGEWLVKTGNGVFGREPFRVHDFATLRILMCAHFSVVYPWAVTPKWSTEPDDGARWIPATVLFPCKAQTWLTMTSFADTLVVMGNPALCELRLAQNDNLRILCVGGNSDATWFIARRGPHCGSEFRSLLEKEAFLTTVFSRPFTSLAYRMTHYATPSSHLIRIVSSEASMSAWLMSIYYILAHKCI
jgi:hypothetical protein